MSGERSRSIERIQKSGTPQVEVLSKLACVAGGMACAKIKFWRRGGIVGAREIKFWPRSRQKRAAKPREIGISKLYFACAYNIASYAGYIKTGVI